MKNQLQLLILSSSLFISHVSSAQITFQKIIGGSGDDKSYCIIATSDAGYAICGYTYSYGAGDGDVYVVKLDSNWNIKWTRTIDERVDDEGHSIIQTNDGGYAISGQTGSFQQGNQGISIVKMDSNGVVQWTKTTGEHSLITSSSIIQTEDGGYTITGTSNGPGHLFIERLSNSGYLQWSKIISNQSTNAGYSIIQTNDGGYAVSGVTNGAPEMGSDVFIVKTDSSGILQWTKTVGGSDYEDAHSIIRTRDGGYALCGSTASFGDYPRDNIYILKMDSTWNLEWTKTLGGGNVDAYSYSIIQCSDGGFAIVGNVEDSSSHIFVSRFDKNGNFQWGRTIGDANESLGRSIVQTKDKGYILAGYALTDSLDYDIYLVKLDSNGNTCGISGNIDSTGTGGTITDGVNVLSTASDSAITEGIITSSGGTIANICFNVGIHEIDAANAFFIYPNPALSSIQIHLPSNQPTTLTIFNLLGEKMREEKVSSREVTIDVSDLPAGMYVVRTEKEVMGKFVKE